MGDLGAVVGLYLGVGLPDHGLGQDVVDNLVGNALAGSHQLVELQSRLYSLFSSSQTRQYTKLSSLSLANSFNQCLPKWSTL